MKDLIFDVMLNGRFICTMKYRFCPLIPIPVDPIEEIVKANKKVQD